MVEYLENYLVFSPRHKWSSNTNTEFCEKSAEESKMDNYSQRVSLTFDIEDIYGDIEKPLFRVLEFLESKKIRATFFVLGRVVVKNRELVRMIDEFGHEVAYHGFNHIPVREMTPHEFETDLNVAQQFFCDLLKTNVVGYRSPNYGIKSWAIKILKKKGYLYDSSVFPCYNIPGWYGCPKAPVYPYHPDMRFIDRIDFNNDFIEFPIAVSPTFRLPCGSGWWIRNLGTKYAIIFLTHLLEKWGFAVICLHQWEFDLNLNSTTSKRKFKMYPLIIFKNRHVGEYLFKLLDMLLRNPRIEFVRLKDAIRSIEVY